MSGLIGGVICRAVSPREINEPESVLSRRFDENRKSAIQANRHREPDDRLTVSKVVIPSFKFTERVNRCRSFTRESRSLFVLNLQKLLTCSTKFFFSLPRCDRLSCKTLIDVSAKINGAYAFE